MPCLDVAGDTRRVLLCFLLVTLLWRCPARAEHRLTPDFDPPYVAGLEQPDVGWLELVDLLITAEEKAYFLRQTESFRRAEFIDAFWRVRDPDPATRRSELRDTWEEKGRLAQSRWGSLLDGRSRVFLVREEPFTYCVDRTRELETWYYPLSEDEVFPISFLRLVPGRPYEIWIPGKLEDPVMRRKIPEVDAVWRFCGQDNPELGLKRIVRSYRGKMDYAMSLDALLEPPPEPSEEWVASFAAATSDLPSGAETFEAALSVNFPGGHGQRTVLQGIAAVPSAVAGVLEQTSGSSHRFVLIGEVVRDGRLFESFRYDFELPAAEGPLPLVFQRQLRPGPIRLLVKVEDLFGRRFAHFDRDLAIPQASNAAATPELADSELMSLLAEADAAAARGESLLRLITPPGAVLTGLVRFETIAAGELERVTFFLDDRPILSKRKPPYSVELDLGDSPAPHLLRVSGFDAEGLELARDELQLNPGGQRFRVRLTEPPHGGQYRTSLHAAVDVVVPDGQEVERVELFLDQQRVATLYQPPFTQPVVLTEPGAMAYLRAVAFLADGSSTEDVVLVNAPDYLELMDVQLVEIYARVEDQHGQPVPELEKEAFTVLEDDEPQELRRFEWVSNLPIRAGLLLDTSASMETSLASVSRAALEFVRQAIRPEDRLALMTFDQRPRVVESFTNDVEAVERSLAALRSEGGTSLYDSLVFALHYFHGVKGQKALLLLSDGQDESSGLSFDDALDYARRAGVLVYAIALGEAAEKRGHRRVLRQIAGETGGRAFFAREARNLDAVFSAIQEDLRSRYLLVYQSASSKGPAEFRRVEIRVNGDADAEVRAMNGYYP